MVNRIDRSREANILRKSKEYQKALDIYWQLEEEQTDEFIAAGLLHCLRKLKLYDEATQALNKYSKQNFKLDWYNNEVIWTLIQGKLERSIEELSLNEMVSIANQILSLNPTDISSKWRVVSRVLKKAKLQNRWDIIDQWISQINYNDLSTDPIISGEERGWSDQAVWYNYFIPLKIKKKEFEQAISLAESAAKEFRYQSKFFLRFKAIAYIKMEKITEAKYVYKQLCNTPNPEWWLLQDYARVLRDSGEIKDSLKLMCKAAEKNKRLQSLVAVFADIGFICMDLDKHEEARDHLLLCKLVRLDQGWSVPDSVAQAIQKFESSEVSKKKSPVMIKDLLNDCRKFWITTIGKPDERTEVKKRRSLQGKLELGRSDRPYCFIKTDNGDSYFCSKQSLPKNITDKAEVIFDAVPSYDKKKQKNSWKATHVRYAEVNS